MMTTTTTTTTITAALPQLQQHLQRLLPQLQSK